MKPSCHDARKERTAQDSGCMNNSFYKNQAQNKKKMIRLKIGADLVFGRKNLTEAGFEPGTDGF